MSSGQVFPEGAAVVFDAVEPGQLFELRVLSGLHLGAALPLFGECWCIGARQDADLELYDPGVEGRHAQLHCIDGRWTVQALEGLLQDETGTARAQIADLAPGIAFSVGGIRLCVANSQSAWGDEPAAVPRMPSESLYEQKSPAAEGRRTTWLAASLTVLLLALAGQVWQPSTKAQATSSKSSAISDRRLLGTTHQVHQQLLKMLIERELGNQIRLEVAGDQIVLTGDVAKDALALVARMLDRFAAQFETSVSVINKVQEISSMLPFRIVQIIGGKTPHVVLADGHRLFLGNETDGLRLTAIDNRRLLFEGRQRYEVNW